jgi:hypothetical protein
MKRQIDEQHSLLHVSEASCLTPLHTSNSREQFQRHVKTPFSDRLKTGKKNLGRKNLEIRANLSFPTRARETRGKCSLIENEFYTQV